MKPLLTRWRVATRLLTALVGALALASVLTGLPPGTVRAQGPATRMALLSNAVDIDVRRWAAAVVVNGGSVSPARLALVSTLVRSLKVAGTWQLTDDYWLLVAENAPQALTSLKQRRLALAVNSPTFTANAGYALNGSTNYIDTGFICSTMAQAMSLGNVRLSVYERTNNNNNTTPLGATDNPSGALNFIVRPRGSANFAVSQMQSSTATGTDTITDSRGLTSSSRADNGSTILFYKNGVALTPVTGVSSLGTVLPPRPLYIGANNNAGTAASFRASTIGWAAVGAPLSALQELANYNAIQAFMTAVGANV